MDGAEISIRSLELEILSSTDEVIDVTWRVRFKCGNLLAGGKCKDYKNRPQTCQSYVCGDKDPDNQASRADLAAMNELILLDETNKRYPTNLDNAIIKMRQQAETIWQE